LWVGELDLGHGVSGSQATRHAVPSTG